MITLVYRSEARESKFELMKRLINEFSEGKITYCELWKRLNQDQIDARYLGRSFDEYNDRVSSL